MYPILYQVPQYHGPTRAKPEDDDCAFSLKVDVPHRTAVLVSWCMVAIMIITSDEEGLQKF